MLFKICSTFDSTDAGNIGPVMDALRADAGEAIVLVTPAFPETGRTVYQGNLFVGSVPLNESPLKDHPLNPMHDSNLVRVLARQSRTEGRAGRSCRHRAAGRTPCARVSPSSRRQGFWRGHRGCGVRPRSRNHRRRSRSIIALSVGASGLGLGLARALVASGRVKSNAPDAISDAPVGGPAACLAGSCSQATLQQIASAEAVMPVLHLDPEQVVAGKDEARRALAWARERLGQRSGPDRLAVRRRIRSRPCRRAMAAMPPATRSNRRWPTSPQGLVQSGVRRLVVAGGETSGAVVDRLAIPGFLVGAEIAAGVPVLRAVGANDGEMLLALKSGNFGGRGFFSDALKLMR